jgi:hypothetical protein
MAAAHPMVHLLQDAVSFPSADAPKEHFVPIRPFVQDPGLIDIGRESSLELAPLGWIVGETSVPEVVEEWL